MQWIEWTRCPECDSIAEVVDRDVWPSTDGPVEHVHVRCVRRHRFVMPAASLAATQRRERPRRWPAVGARPRAPAGAAHRAGRDALTTGLPERVSAASTPRASHNADNQHYVSYQFRTRTRVSRPLSPSAPLAQARSACASSRKSSTRVAHVVVGV